MPNGYLRRRDPSSANRTESLEIAILPRYLIERDFPDGITGIYDGPAPEAVRRAAVRKKLSISRITEVRVLDPYFYK
jgi:hypothetical protein